MGDFGPDDVLGRLNLVGPEQVRKGVVEAREGIVFCLSLPLDLPGRTVLSANRFPPVVRPTLRSGAVNFNCSMAVAHPGATDVMSDDLVVLHTQYSTQWDAFGHAGALFDADCDGVPEPVYYNGWRAGTDAVGPAEPDSAGLGSLSRLDGAAEGTARRRMPAPSTSRRWLGTACRGGQSSSTWRRTSAGPGPSSVSTSGRGCSRRMRSSSNPADLLLLHTGFARKVQAQAGRPTATSLDVCAVLDGADPDLQGWIRESGVAAIASDNFAVEAFPPLHELHGEPALPLHELCLFRLGVHLGELWWLSDLADHLRAAGRSRCLLTAPPLRLPGPRPGRRSPRLRRSDVSVAPAQLLVTGAPPAAATRKALAGRHTGSWR